MAMDSEDIDRITINYLDKSLNESPKLWSPRLKKLSRLESLKSDLSNFSILQCHNLYQYSYTMNALEILRENIKTLRKNATSFMTIAANFVWLVSAILLSNALGNQSILKRLVMKLLLVAQSSGLPLSHLVIMYSFVMLIDSMMSAVLCFTCRSSCMATVEEECDEPVELHAIVSDSGDM